MADRDETEDAHDRPEPTPLDGLHRALGAKMTGFAGALLPLQYPAGVLAEHLHTRAAASLFDVSHMGQIELRPRAGAGAVAEVAAALERLAPIDAAALGAGRQRYGLLTLPDGGIQDDFMVAHLGDRLLFVANAARKARDLAALEAGCGDVAEVRLLPDRALIALQGPAAEAALAALAPAARALRFLDVAELEILGVDCVVSRSGYTGEDGFEISAPAERAVALAEALLAQPGVAPAGLGARDSLRLEAGLCLYGADLDETTSPVEADLVFALGKARRPGGARAGGYPGAARIERELAEGPARRRFGLLPEGRAPMRAGVPLFAADTPSDDAAEPIGWVSSGGFGPSLGAPLAMGYVAAAAAEPGRLLFGEVRGKRLPVRVAATPFVAPSYKRAG